MKGTRIAWIVARKDIEDAVRNRTILVNLVSVAFLVLLYRFLPLMAEPADVPRVAVYDQGQSALAAGLEYSASIAYWEARSLESMKAYLVGQSRPSIGVVLPKDVDAQAVAGQALTVEGYVPHWVRATEVGTLRRLAGKELTVLAGVPVQIETSGNAVYPEPGWGGLGFTASLTLTLIISITAVSVVAHLVLEEKQAETIDALLVSPASSGQILAGKAIAGLFYCLAASAAVFAGNTFLVVHWGLAVATVVAGSVFAVTFGLLLGSLFQSRQQLVLWGFLLISALLIPVILAFERDILPDSLVTALRWVPTVAISWAFRVSLARDIPWRAVAWAITNVLGSAIILYLLLVWRVRRAER